MLLGFGFLFSFISLFRGGSDGYLFTIILQTIAAGEAALIFSLLVSLNTRLIISSQLNHKMFAFLQYVSNFCFFSFLEIHYLISLCLNFFLFLLTCLLLFCFFY